MRAIFKREFKSYFTSAAGYVFLGIFFAIAGLLFYAYNIFSNSTSMSSLYSYLLTIMTFIIPILTMRLMSEDKKQKTDQLLLTSPTSFSGVVLGKFFAALAVFGIGLAITVVYTVALAIFGSIDLPVIIGSIIGMLLLAGAMISIGLFISSLTESQVIAAIASIFILFVLNFINSVSSYVSNSFLSGIIYAVSISSRYDSFATGVLNLGDVVYYLSIAGIFIFLTVRSLEKRRWS